MRNTALSTRVFVTLALLVALAVIATPAAADPGAETAFESIFAQFGPPDDVTVQCNWWIPWCW